MKRKKVLLALILFLSLVFMLKENYVFAEPEVSTNTENDIDKKEVEEKNSRKKEILAMIDECIDEMKAKILEIDTKEVKVKKQKEFEHYPAIRLNVDTPVFGFISMVDNKLKIRKDVSTVDVANGYSIKHILNSKKIKLPDFTVGSIVVSTRDVEINDEMSYEDANMTLLKIMQYMSQLDSANEFLDFQINRTFRGYIDKEKSDKINDIKSRNSKISSSLIELDKKITYLHIIKNDDDKLNNINKTYDSISAKNKSINTSVKDMLMSNEALSALQKEVIEAEGKLVDFISDVDKEYEIAIDFIDEEKMLLSIKEELIGRRDNVKKYIDEAVYTKKIESDNNSEEQEKKEEKEITNEEKVEEKNDEIIKRYEVTSKNTLEYLNNAISSINDKIEKYVKKEDNDSEQEKEDEKNTDIKDEDKNNPINQEIANKEDVTKVDIKTLTKDEKKTLVDDVYKIYSDFLSRENKFYLDNTNFLINDTSKKTSDLISKSDGDVLSCMKYMYIELPDKLKEYINNNNMSSKRELKKLTNSLKEELGTIVEFNVKVTKLYDKLIQDELKS